MRKLLLFSAVAIGMSSSMVIAQQKSYVPIQLKKISLSEGGWSGIAKMTIDDSTYEIPYNLEISSTNGGRTYLAEENYEVEPHGLVTGVSMIAYNTNDHLVHWFRSDNLGNCRKLTGKWVNGTNFVMEATETIEGKSFVETTKLTFWGKNTIDISIERKLDEQVTEEVTATLNRKM